MRHRTRINELLIELCDAEESLQAAIATFAAVNHPAARYGQAWQRAADHQRSCAAAVLVARQRVDEYRRYGDTRRTDRLTGGAA